MFFYYYLISYLLLLYSYLDISLDESNKQLKEHINKPISRQLIKTKRISDNICVSRFVSRANKETKRANKKGRK